jgi:hypothetical protein
MPPLAFAVASVRRLSFQRRHPRRGVSGPPTRPDGPGSGRLKAA